MPATAGCTQKAHSPQSGRRPKGLEAGGQKPPAQAPAWQGWRTKSRTPAWARWPSARRLSSPGGKPPIQVHIQDQMNPLNRLRDLPRAGSPGSVGGGGGWRLSPNWWRPHSQARHGAEAGVRGPPARPAVVTPGQMRAAAFRVVHTSSAHRHKAPTAHTSGRNDSLNPHGNQEGSTFPFSRQGN